MTGPQGMGTLIPNIQISSGGIGGPSKSEYDLAVEALAPIWYVWDVEPQEVEWGTTDEVILEDSRSESVRGIYWFDAWFEESGLTPLSYWLALDDHINTIWYEPMATDEAITSWPTISTVLAGDYRNESVYGLHWFNAWFEESGEAPVSYWVSLSSHINTIWYAPMATTTSSTDTIPVGGTITTPGDGYRYHRFTNNLDSFWTMSPSSFSLEILLVGGGGERVVLDGVMKIGPGAPVQVVDPSAMPQDGAKGPPGKSADGKGAKGPAADKAAAPDKGKK